MQSDQTGRMRSQKDIAAQQIQLRKQQEQLFRDLLPILDNLDRACDHWQQAQQAQAQFSSTPMPNASTVVPVSVPPLGASTRWGRRWQRWRWRLGTWIAGPDLAPYRQQFEPSSPHSSVIPPHLDPQRLDDMIESAQSGITMIRSALLQVLSQYQVEPINAYGQPFDPTRMLALGQIENGSVPERYVAQEVLRGYLWQDKVLREAQVMVAMTLSPPSSPSSPSLES
jgi:molecular chaperone GrpE (heat shock protein)